MGEVGVAVVVPRDPAAAAVARRPARRSPATAWRATSCPRTCGSSTRCPSPRWRRSTGRAAAGRPLASAGPDTGVEVGLRLADRDRPPTGRTGDRDVPGPGLDRLREVAEVVLDPWIDHVPLRIWDGAKLAARVQGGRRDHPRRRVRLRDGRRDHGRRAHRHRLVPGRPQQRRRGRRPPPGASPCSTRRAATPTAWPRWPSPSRSPPPAGWSPPTATCGPATVFRDDTIPYQRYRAWQLAGRTVGIVGLGAVGRAAAWRFDGLGMRRHLLRPVQPRGHPRLARGAARRGRRRVDARRGHRRTPLGHDGRRAVRRDARRRRVRQHRPGRPARPRRADRGAARRASCPRPALDHFDGEQLPDGHPLTAMDNVVLTPHIGGATYDTEVNHSAMLADDIARLLAGEQAAALRQPGGAAMRDDGRRSGDVSDSTPPARQVKDSVLAAAKAHVRARAWWRAPRATCRAGSTPGPGGGHPVLGRATRRMTLDDLVLVDLDGDGASRAIRSPTSEKALHLECYRRYPEVQGVVHCHAKHASMFAVAHRPIPAGIDEFVIYIGGDVPCADYRQSGSDELATEVALAPRGPVGRADGEPRHGVRRQVGRRRPALGARGRAQRPDHVGRRGARRRGGRSPRRPSPTSPTSTASCAARCGSWAEPAAQAPSGLWLARSGEASRR